MKSNMATQFLKSILFAALIAAPTFAQADDTDIYYGNNNNTSAPLVMFTIDIRPSSGSNFQCTSTAAGNPNATPPVPEGCLHYFQNNAATKCEFYNNTNGCPANSYTISGVGDLYEYLRLSLKVALSLFEGLGVNVGLMINHDNKNNCAGPSNASSSSCSNGAMVTMGFTALNTDHVARDRMNDQLRGVKVYAQDTNGAAGKHPYQGTELFFELFRYLTGKKIYNGHVGNADFGGAISQGSGNVRKTAGTATTTAQKGNHCGPLTAPGTYTAGADPTITNGSNPDKYKDDGVCWDNSSPSSPLTDQIQPVENNAHDTYVSPLTGNSCGKIYTINFINGQVNADGDSNAAIQVAPSGSSVDSGMGLNLGNSNEAKTVVSWLNTHNLRDAANNYPISDTGAGTVTSYVLYTGQATDALDIAKAGGTSTPTEVKGNQNGDIGATVVVDLIAGIFRQILSVSTTFVAAAIPANVFNRAQSLDNVYIALFQPTVSGAPFWNGNMKKLKIKAGAGADALYGVGSGQPDAINTGDGRIRDDATSFWTNTAKLDTRQYNTSTKTPATGWRSGDATAATDGRQVNRGAAGQLIKGYETGQPSVDDSTAVSPKLTNATTGARQVFYDPAGTYPNTGASTDLKSLDVNGLVPGTSESDLCAASGPLGLTGVSDANCQPLLKFMRGIDPAVTNVNNLSRSWIMADPLHSRPAPVNYGKQGNFTKTNPAIYIALSGNDGVLHFVKNTNDDGTESGQEMWAFIPTKAMSIQNTLMLNSPGVHPYGLDGSPVAYVNDVGNDGTVGGSDTVYLYVGMRRGGRMLYALDVTKPEVIAGDSTSGPKLRWKIDNTTTGFSELGYTFSNPKIGPLNVGGNLITALFFGGGYSTNKDTDATGTNDSYGRAVYVVNAKTGALIWKAEFASGVSAPGTSSGTNPTVFQRGDMTDSIPSEVSIGDTDGDTNHLIDRLIVGDTGGRVWRADFSGNDPTKWTMNLVANLGRNGIGGATKLDDRRFFNQPKIVQTVDANGVSFDAYVIGSGDREDPRDNGGPTTNYMYMIRDNRVNPLFISGSTVPPDLDRLDSQITDLTADCIQVGSTGTCTGLNTPSLANGWKIQLNHSSSPNSEKNLSPALVVGNVVFFTTYKPAPSSGTSCAPSEGTGLFYAVNLQDATAAFNYDVSGGSSSDAPSTASDRTQNLNSSGIPAQPVFVSSIADGGGGGGGGGGRSCNILKPDLSFGDCNSTTRIKTFFQRVESVPQ